MTKDCHCEDCSPPKMNQKEINALLVASVFTSAILLVWLAKQFLT